MKTYIIDSFTDKPFKGNPAGVALVENDITEEKMQHIAHELGLSETAFVKHKKDNVYSIRFFSPLEEIPLCGHATLASAKVIFDEQDLDEIHFLTKSGVDLVTKKEDDFIAMEFPTYGTTPANAPQELLEALGIDEIVNAEYNKENNILLVEIADPQLLVDLTPDFVALKKSTNSISGVLVTSHSNNPEYDFQSRYFWPWVGTNEDPVTGATHTFLAPYWGKRKNLTKMKSFQASKRTGFMELQLLENGNLIIKGKAVSILEGSLTI
ncbi:PhzF family phenazine biosynthesis protein [Saonia flava]|uniref:PhzF family phenazine biosynthesis protein n=1 Tax=Saonia flava TaxID=523696 RepID=A0A846QRZ5_9FLAO|nr:PhzF family phenazine biosynthesis protein [Saonia flava]NJB69967.1 PhzF family phenazine biosynthesis protein [Saonia flava]